MKKFLLLTFAALTLIGCRQTDVRSVELRVKGITEKDRDKIVAAFFRSDAHAYDGVFLDSLTFDFAAGTIKLNYDSMKIAHTNLRMLLAEKGFAVEFPTNTTGVAGYVP